MQASERSTSERSTSERSTSERSTAERSTARHTPGAAPGSVVGCTAGEHRATYPVDVLGVSRPVNVSGSTADRIAAIARLQRGSVTRNQLRAAGLTDRMIQTRVARGLLHRVHRSVYAVGHTAPIPLGPETAAILACGEGAVLSHLSAGCVYEIVRHTDGRIHVTTPNRHGPDLAGVVVHRTSTLSPADVRIRRRLPITSPARTVLDLADLVDDRELSRAVDEALLQRLVTKRELERLATEGRRGAGRLKRSLARHTTSHVTRSELERRMHDLIRAGGLPQPEMNARIAGYEVDFVWRRERVVVEVDGYRFHSSRPAFERDRAKGNTLVAAGLVLLRFTWWQIDREPFAVLARIATALARAEAA
jgi:very-short-patch-repair endonuclease